MNENTTIETIFAALVESTDGGTWGRRSKHATNEFTDAEKALIERMAAHLEGFKGGRVSQFIRDAVPMGLLGVATVQGLLEINIDALDAAGLMTSTVK
jgi:hypothetical protein